MTDPLFEQLVQRAVDRTADDAEHERLEAMLLADPGARRFYIDYCVTHALLAWRTGENAMPLTPPSVSAGRWLRRSLRYAAAAAIVLAFAGVMSLLVVLGGSHSRRNVGPAIATLIDSRDAVWETGDPPTTPGSQLHGGFLHLRSGEVDIEFRSGATVTLTGPAEFGLNSTMRGFLRRGTLTAHVPAPAHGFTIGAPGLAVVDLGTAFHLVVNSHGASRINVLRGKVRVDLLDDAGKPIRHSTLVENQVAAIGTDQRVTISTPQPRPISIPIMNSSFEDDGRNVVRNAPSRWQATLSSRAGAENHVIDGSIRRGVSGQFVGLLNARAPGLGDPPGVQPALYQTTGARVVPGAVYTLRVDIGRRLDSVPDGSPSVWQISLNDAAGGRELAGVTGTTLVAGEMREQKLTWTAGPDDAGVLLQVRLTNLSEINRQSRSTQINFDNVRLEYVEPINAPVSSHTSRKEK